MFTKKILVVITETNAGAATPEADINEMLDLTEDKG